MATRAAPALARASNVSSTSHAGSWHSTASGRSRGQVARNAASRSSLRLTPVGTRNSTQPSLSPNARYGPVSHGTLVAGSVSDRAEPPRCALTVNRNAAGVAASHAATLAGDGCW